MQKVVNKKRELVDFFLKKGVLLSQELLSRLDKEEEFSEVYKLGKEELLQKIIVLNKEVRDSLKEPTTKLGWKEPKKLKTVTEKTDKDHNKELGQALEEKTYSKVKIVCSYDSKPKKREAQDFIDYYNLRYKTIKKILKQRQELQNIVSINRIRGKRDKGQVSIIGIVSDVRQTKNGNLFLTLEDETGSIGVIINKNKPELYNKGKDVVLDEVVGIAGANGENIVFANNLLFPDIPLTGEIKKSKEEVYALFLSDMHVGSNNFLKEDFQRFLKWINQEIGNETQRQIASKVRYIFLIGDLVDGCGVYPGQEEELEIKDIKDQYKECAYLLSKIPRNIKLIICPGNHDAMRVAEPQYPIYRDFSETLYDLPNATFVSNPAIINIHSTETFSGFDVLLYHGYSFDFYVAEVESIRKGGGYDRADLIMKFLLQKRHLAPTHSSTLYVPDTDIDSLVIEKVPDFFASGHIHKTSVANYKNVTLVSGSCWQSKTSFQEKVGHNPEPSRVPLVNLQTRHVKILKFGK